MEKKNIILVLGIVAICILIEVLWIYYSYTKSEPEKGIIPPEPVCGECQYLENHRCINYLCCNNSDCYSAGYRDSECKDHSCQPKKIVADIETVNNLIILKNKDDVVYTYDECHVPDKIAVEESKVMKYVYSKFDDLFDYAIITDNFEACRAIQQRNVRNEIEGIGLSKYDDKSYGSDSSLKGVVRMGSVAKINGSISADSEYLFLHEFGHNWALFINSSLKDEYNHYDQSADLGECDAMSASGANWAYDSDFNMYFPQPCLEEWQYSDLTLYLMGLVSEDEISNQKFRLFDSTQKRILKTTSIDEIISANGKRIPNSEESPKKFRVAFILVTDSSGPSEIEIETAQRLINDYGNWFREATKGRASLDFSVAQYS